MSLSRFVVSKSDFPDIRQIPRRQEKQGGMAAGEAGWRRYSHKELTQSVIRSCCVKVDIKSFYQKKGITGGE